MTTKAQATALGFYGKAVTHGDFLSRNLPNSFLTPWDAWLQRGLALSKTQLGEDWLPHYLSSPIWRFALSGNVCGEAVVAGVLMPSVDSVGRHFPMTLACLLKDNSKSPVDILSIHSGWFSQCEEAALTCLEESFTAETFTSRLESIEELSVGKINAAKNGTGDTDSAGTCSSMPLHKGLGVKLSVPNANPDWDALSLAAWDGLAKEQFGNYSLWWSAGSETIPPTVLTYSGLPGNKEFAGLLRGIGH